MPPRLVSDQLLDLFPMKRTPGRHVSSGIHRIMRRLHPDRFTDTPIDRVRAALGNALENALADEFAKLYPDRYVRPGELFFDDHYGTPDLWDLNPTTLPKCRRCGKRCPAITEIKLTWASSRRATDIEDPWFWRYWVQGKSYAKMSGLHRVVVIICFVVGDWRDGPPVGMMWENHFDDDELDENWAMVKAYSAEEGHGND